MAGRRHGRRREAEEAILELRSVLHVTRVELDEARDDAKGVSLAKQDLERVLAEVTTKVKDLYLKKFSVEASLWCLSDQATHAQEEMFRLSSELGALRAKRDEAVDSVAAAREEAFQFSTELVALRSEAEASRAPSADSYISRETSRVELEAARLLRYKILGRTP
ncbi:hypothetical protein ACLOJK_013887 [Asimina triloba]